MMNAGLSRKYNALFALAAVLLFLLLGCGGCKEKDLPAKNEGVGKTEKIGPQKLLMPSKGAYTGAYIDFGEGEDEVTYDALTDFEQLTGKHVAVIAFGSFWGEQTFPAKTTQIISGYGAIPLIFWSPWDRPYTESQGPDRFNLTDILAGKWDAYIDQWADGARNYGKPLLVTWGLEMNGSWFPWSGNYYGGGEVIGEKDGLQLYAGPELFKQAYRYVVDRVRARKADNILWGFHANNFDLPRDSWNTMGNYYPGANYVDWLGLSVYGKMIKAEGWASFNDVMEDPYEAICRLDPQKPVILAEWGVAEFPPGDKAAFIASALSDLTAKYPRVRAAVYWHERWENKDGTYSNLRVNSSPEALKAYQTGIADSYWVDWPQYVP